MHFFKFTKSYTPNPTPLGMLNFLAPINEVLLVIFSVLTPDYGGYPIMGPLSPDQGFLDWGVEQ